MTTFGRWQNSLAPVRSDGYDLYNVLVGPHESFPGPPVIPGTGAYGVSAPDFSYASGSYEVTSPDRILNLTAPTTPQEGQDEEEGPDIPRGLNTNAVARMTEALAQTAFTSVTEVDPDPDTFYAGVFGTSQVGRNMTARAKFVSDVYGGKADLAYSLIIVDTYLQSRPEALNVVQAAYSPLYQGLQYAADGFSVQPNTYTRAAIWPGSAAYTAGVLDGRCYLEITARILMGGGSNFGSGVRFNIALVPMDQISIRGYADHDAVFADNYDPAAATFYYDRRIALPHLTAPPTAAALRSFPVIGTIPSYDELHAMGAWSFIYTDGTPSPTVGDVYLGYGKNFADGFGIKSAIPDLSFDATQLTDSRVGVLIYPQMMVDQSNIPTDADFDVALSAGFAYAGVQYTPRMQWRGTMADPVLAQSLRNSTVAFSPA